MATFHTPLPPREKIVHPNLNANLRFLIGSTTVRKFHLGAPREKTTTTTFPARAPRTS